MNQTDREFLARSGGTQVGSEGVKGSTDLRGEAIDIIP